MFETMRGALAPARGWLCVAAMTLIAVMPDAACADGAVADIRTLPRPQGAFDAKQTDAYSFSYGVNATSAVAIPAVQKLLLADGWAPFVEPSEEPSSSLFDFKKGRQGLLVFFRPGDKADQSVVSYTARNPDTDLPFPGDATGILFNDSRPYLYCLTKASVEDTLAFFKTELQAEGWSLLTAEGIAARWPDADIRQTIDDGAVAVFGNEKRRRPLPIMVSLRRGAGGATAVDIRIAPFALPKDLRAGPDQLGLPKPRPEDVRTAASRGTASGGRETMAAVIAEIPVVTAFYRRELAARNWKEEANGAVVTPDKVVLNFSSDEEIATLALTKKCDLTIATLDTRLKEQAIAARAKAKKEADEKFSRDADEAAKKIMAEDAARRVTQAASLSDAPIRTRAGNTLPVPLPENADNVQFDGDSAELEFDSASSVKALAAFYRASLKSQGWRETPSVINKPTMVGLEFSEAGKLLSFTIMQMGAKVNVSADGNGLVMAKAKPGTAVREADAADDSAAVEKLDAEPDSALPVPKQHTMRSLGSNTLPGGGTPFRKQLDASVPVNLASVLAFYRDELGKRGWKESADHTLVKPDQAELAFSTPDGPAMLKLGRSNGETSINLVQKIPAAATQADVMPKPGQAKLLLSNFGNGQATLTINRQTITVAPGAGSPQSKGPVLDLPPGKYSYSLKVGGGAVRTNTIELAADDTWGLMISPKGEAMPLQVY